MELIVESKTNNHYSNLEKFVNWTWKKFVMISYTQKQWEMIANITALRID